MKTNLILGLLLLAVPTTIHARPRPASDGYYFEQGDMQRTKMTLTIELYPSEEALRASSPEFANFPELVAKSTWMTQTPVCTIKMVDPAKLYEPEFIGHELVHCIYGRWHNSQNAIRMRSAAR